MHVGLIGHCHLDSFADNIGDSLTRMGHQVTHLGSTQIERGGYGTMKFAATAFRAFPQMESRFHLRLVHAALESRCEAVITTIGSLSPQVVEVLRRNGVPVALWFPDAVSNLDRQRMLTAPYAALFFKDRLLVQRLRDTLDVPVWYLPQACNPSWHRPIGDAATGRAIVLAGNMYPSRFMLIRRLHEAGIPMVIYGGPVARWARDLLPPGLHTGRYVAREEKSRVFRGAVGVLNNLHPAEMHGVNLRLFEATAAGAAVLCEERPTLGELFDLDREVVPFRTFAELVTRAEELLSSHGLTKEIGDAASKRAHAEHSYEARLHTILEKLT
ncbi:MAG: CgeB family protein [Streptomycetales bacterium]